MFFERNRHLYQAVLLCLALLLGGCSANTNFGWIDNDVSPSVDELPLEQDPDLVPVALESETRLDQELEALALTGSWDDQSTGTVQRDAPTDFDEPSVTYDFPVTINRQVELYLDLFQGKQRKYFSRWLARSGRYIPMMHAELEAAGLPKDLVYLSMIESGFNQRA